MKWCILGAAFVFIILKSMFDLNKIIRYSIYSAMCGIYHERGFEIATDGLILAKLKSDYLPEKEGKIELGTSAVLRREMYCHLVENNFIVGVKYPDYQRVLDDISRYPSYYDTDLDIITASIKTGDNFLSDGHNEFAPKYLKMFAKIVKERSMSIKVVLTENPHLYASNDNKEETCMISQTIS